MAKKTKPQRAAGKPSAEIGIIGGSGLYEMPGLESVREVRIKTPFGDPSDALVAGKLEGKRVAFLSRHARGQSVFTFVNRSIRSSVKISHSSVLRVENSDTTAPSGPAWNQCLVLGTSVYCSPGRSITSWNTV